MKVQKIVKNLTLFGWLVCAVEAQADLIDRGNGMVYDQELNLTWLQDANYSFGAAPLTNGAMTWDAANQWASTLVVGDFSDWRLPTTTENSVLTADGEVGHLFINELGGTPGIEVNWTHGSGYDVFSNVMLGRYWTATDWTGHGDFAWGFVTDGTQNHFEKAGLAYVWAVRAGDVVTAVPLPVTAWLFLGGLIGILGITRKKSVD